MSAQSELKLLPSGFPVRRRGSCVPAAYIILLRLHGAQAIYGYVGPRLYDQHTWVELDGKILDPTIRQFRWWRADAAVNRQVVYRQEASKFIPEFERWLDEPWRDEGHHYRKFQEWFSLVPEEVAR